MGNNFLKIFHLLHLKEELPSNLESVSHPFLKNHCLGLGVADANCPQCKLYILARGSRQNHIIHKDKIH